MKPKLSLVKTCYALKELLVSVYKIEKGMIMATGYKEDPKNKTVELTIDGRVTKDEFNQISNQMDAFIGSY
jgi:hypothetical protein